MSVIMPTEQQNDGIVLTTLDPKKWVDLYADYLFRYAVVRVRNEDPARDLVQDTFLAGLKAMDRFQGKSSERTWLTGILKHKIIDLYRKESSGLDSRKQISSTELQQEDFFDSNDGHWKREHAPQEFVITTEDAFQHKEFGRILESCMKKLPALWASVFVMKHMDEEKTEVILAELKLTSSNFWVIIHRTKLNLRACLQKNWL